MNWVALSAFLTVLARDKTHTSMSSTGWALGGCSVWPPAIPKDVGFPCVVSASHMSQASEILEMAPTFRQLNRATGLHWTIDPHSQNTDSKHIFIRIYVKTHSFKGPCLGLNSTLDTAHLPLYLEISAWSFALRLSFNCRSSHALFHSPEMFSNSSPPSALTGCCRTNTCARR